MHHATESFQLLSGRQPTGNLSAISASATHRGNPFKPRATLPGPHSCHVNGIRGRCQQRQHHSTRLLFLPLSPWSQSHFSCSQSSGRSFDLVAGSLIIGSGVSASSAECHEDLQQQAYANQALLGPHRPRRSPCLRLLECHPVHRHGRRRLPLIPTTSPPAVVRVVRRRGRGQSRTLRTEKAEKMEKSISRSWSD